jgi:hypothetical protein
MTALSAGQVTIEASVGGVTGNILMQVAEPYRLDVSVATSGSPEPVGTGWACTYSARLEGVGGREGDGADLTQVLILSRTVSGETGSLLLTPALLGTTFVGPGDSKTLSGTDRSDQSDRTETLEFIVDWVEAGEDHSVSVSGGC